MGDSDIKVATLHSKFPHEAKNTKRLMGLRNFLEAMKVTRMNEMHKTEKQEATRSIVSRALSWPSVRWVAIVAVFPTEDVDLGRWDPW